MFLKNLLISLSLALLLSGCFENPKGKLRVAADLAEATIYVDGEKKAVTSSDKSYTDLLLPEGEYTIEIKKVPGDGWIYAGKKNIFVGENTSAKLDFKLEKTPEHPPLRTFIGHENIVQSVAFSPNGKYALSGSSDNTVKLWDVTSGREVRTFVGTNYSIYSIAFSPDGKYVLSGSSDDTIKLWEVARASE